MIKIHLKYLINFCHLENKDDKIVVTSLINDTFPIIRYVMEDIGTIVNKDGKQYIHNLIGKNTNKIVINNSSSSFSSLDVDKLIDFVNINYNIISIVIKYDDYSIDINYIIYNPFNDKEQQYTINKTNKFMNKYFYAIKYNINFIENYKT